MRESKGMFSKCVVVASETGSCCKSEDDELISSKWVGEGKGSEDERLGRGEGRVVGGQRCFHFSWLGPEEIIPVRILVRTWRKVQRKPGEKFSCLGIQSFIHSFIHPVLF